MIPFCISFLLVGLLWWLFLFHIRSQLWKPLTPTSQNTGPLVLAVATHVFRSASSQNTVTQAFLDFSLRIRSFREAFMLICFERISVVMLGGILLISLEPWLFLAFSGLGSLAFLIAFKKPLRSMQTFFLMGSFFVLYQFSFYQAHHFLFSSQFLTEALWVSDPSFEKGLIFFVGSVVLTLLFRFEGGSVLLASLLFFAGGLPLSSGMMLILGEAFGWGLFWFFQSLSAHQALRKIFLEKLLITVVLIVAFLTGYFALKTLGVFQFPVMGQLEIKKLGFLTLWAAWEFFYTVMLMVWGHFRARSKWSDESDIEVVKFPAGLLTRRDWLPEQIQSYRQRIESRLHSIETNLHELSNHGPLPASLKRKTQQEVESLKSLLGSLPPDSV